MVNGGEERRRMEVLGVSRPEMFRFDAILHSPRRALAFRASLEESSSVSVSVMARDVESKEEKAMRAHSLFVRLVLPPYTIHFKSPTYMREGTLDLLDRKVCKETLKSTANNPAVRQTIGTDGHFWGELVVLFRAAIPSLERRSFTIWDPSSVDYESTSGALIASNYPGLWKDLERLNDLVSISRNVLTIGPAAQDMAAVEGIDNEIFRLINCCVRVTARGYDGEAGTGEEEKWQWIVNAYKKLLITSLQFLNNFVAQNETRKLLLWLSLFDHHQTPEEYSAQLAPEDIPETSRTTLADVPSNPPVAPQPPVTTDDILVAYGTDGTRWISEEEHRAALQVIQQEDKLPPSMQAAVDAARAGDNSKLVPNACCFYGRSNHHRRVELFRSDFKRDPTLAEEHHELVRQWTELVHNNAGEYWEGLFADAKARYRADLAVWEAKQIAHRAFLDRDGLGAAIDRHHELQRRVQELEAEIAEHLQLENGEEEEAVREQREPPYRPPPPEQPLTGILSKEDLQHRETLPDDMKMMFTADAGARILESGKIELMKRLSDYSPPDPNLPPSRNADGIRTRPVHRDGDGRPIERTRSMSRSPQFGWMNGPRNKGEVEAWMKLNEGRRREDMVSLPRQSEIPPLHLPEAVAPPLPVTDGQAVVGAAEDEEIEEEDQEVEGESEEGEEEEDEEEEEEDDDEDYPGSTEDGRGLLTDVPLILGPSEIEVLPMLIMSGIVPPPTQHNKKLSKEEKLELNNLHTVRTHLLLSQSTGRNLLRELLIFVAAWDLREEELYFKFMVKIMEAILTNGLMPYAYHAFRDRSRSKDIISPAQAVIMKLLTCIYRGRSDAYKTAAASNNGSSLPGSLKVTPASFDFSTPPHETGREKAIKFLQSTSSDLDDFDPAGLDRRAAMLVAYPPPSRTDLHTLNFLFTEFRQHIIPQTCALIFLQSQIHVGRASPEDFPLNLWDMERMYEGVYQFLEFFAVLCEDGGAAQQAAGSNNSKNGFGRVDGVLGAGGWGKGVLAEWDASAELVALLRELEGGGEKKDGIVQLRYGKGAAIGAVPAPPVAQAPVRRVSQQPGVVQAQVQGQGQGQQVSATASVSGAATTVIGQQQQQRSSSADAAMPGGAQTHVLPALLPGGGAAVDRPFDELDGIEQGGTILPPLPSTLPLPGSGHSIFEAETPLAYPEDPLNAALAPLTAAALANGTQHQQQLPPPLPLHPSTAATAAAATAAPDQDEPSDFEWRNLKKLTVLVLSSLTWKNRTVRSQIRTHSGLDALLSCCRHDENNPYIREHAIMCLRFAVENDEYNKETVRELIQERAKVEAGRTYTVEQQRAVMGGGEAAMRVMGHGAKERERDTRGYGYGYGGEALLREVLGEGGGYETFVDGRGQVGLRRKDGLSQGNGAHGSSAGVGVGVAALGGDKAGFLSGSAASSSSSALAGGGVGTVGAGVVKAKKPNLDAMAAKMTAEKAAELMQNALRELPLGDKLVTDKQKAEALAKLDKAFESTERVLGRNNNAGNGGSGGGSGSGLGGLAPNGIVAGLLGKGGAGGGKGNGS